MLKNAFELRCPTCGKHRIFLPWYQVRNLRDWFMPLDGCPSCGYAFEREPGYFLLSIFAINYGVGALIGLAVYLILDFWVKLPIAWTLLLTVVPIPFFNLWFARHSKALFIAFDLFCDPHRRGDGGGDQRLQLEPKGNPRPPLRPLAR